LLLGPPVTDTDMRLIHKEDHVALLRSAARDGAREALEAIGIDTPEKAEDLRTALAIGRGVREAQREVWKTIGKALIWSAALGAALWFSGLAPKLGASFGKAAALFTTTRG
jgi:hypothetical protein